MSDLIDRQAVLKHIEKIRQSVQMMDDTRRASILMNGMHLCEEAVRNQPSAQPETCEDAGEKTCRTCHLWEDGEINIACPWGSNYEHYEDDYCSLWEKQN